MILYNLRCRKGHEFEAWFRDSAAYDGQAEAGKVICPTCGNRRVEKAPMAPRLAKGRDKTAPAANLPEKAIPATGGTATNSPEVLKALRELRKQVEANCDYVGREFAEEARKIHYGETDPHGIYGETSDDEARALKDEGIDFCRVPWPTRHDS